MKSNTRNNFWTAKMIVAMCWTIATALVVVDYCSAGTVSNLSVTDNSSPTVFADNLVTGTKRETQSSATLLSSNLVAPMPTFSARLAGMAAADTELPSPTQTAVITLAMQIKFDITALPSETWTVNVNQLRNFALTIADDLPPVHFQSQALIDFTSASYSITPGPSGGLLFPSVGGEDTGLISGFGNVDIPVNQSTADILSGAGSATIQLNFQQRLWAHSFANDNPNATVLAPGQEGAVRFGMLGTLTNVTADDYPGPGARVLADDGHFVNVKVTFVPEPASALMMCCGAALIACGRRRRRRASAFALRATGHVAVDIRH